MIKRISTPYFHIALKYSTPLAFGPAVYLILNEHPVWAVILTLTGIAILTTKYVTEINLKGKYIKDYLSFFGLELDEDLKRVDQLDRIVITKGDYSQMINTRSRSRQLDWVDYTGTLLFDEDGALNLMTRNDKQDLLKGLKEYADFMQVKIEDRTTPQFYWIDLSKL